MATIRVGFVAEDDKSAPAALQGAVDSLAYPAGLESIESWEAGDIECLGELE